jgi:uncharacterized protein (TIGR02145 family)
LVTGLVFGVNYIFSVVATNAVGPSPTITTTTVTPCVLNTVSAGSSSPTLAVNTALTNITHSTTIATGIGTATGLPTGVNAAWSANVITISGTPTATGSFSYEIPLTGGCGIVKATGSMTVGATPACAAAAASTTPTLTVNTALTNITHATTSATGIGIAIGLPAGVSAAWSADVITISGTPTASGTFSYTIPLTGTSCSAVNATGTITVTASACPSLTITYNSYTYNAVAIGTQCWMQENLRTRLYNDGTEIRFNNSGGSDGVTPSQTWSVLDYGAHTIYANDSVASPSNLTNYGYLYNWYAAKGIATAGSTTYKNICPTGWHVPTDSDWNKLIRSIDSGADTTGTNIQSTTAGGKMKSTGDNTAGTGLWNSPNTGADNASGFTVLPGGYRSDVGGSFEYISNLALFWSATESGSTAWFRYMYSSNSDVYIADTNKSSGASVRCLRD